MNDPQSTITGSSSGRSGGRSATTGDNFSGGRDGPHPHLQAHPYPYPPRRTGSDGAGSTRRQELWDQTERGSKTEDDEARDLVRDPAATTTTVVSLYHPFHHEVHASDHENHFLLQQQSQKYINLEENNSTTIPFCRKSKTGGGMIMYMDGFQWTMASPPVGHPPSICLNLLFPSWTLDSPLRFATAWMGIVLAAIVVEGLSKFRHRVVRAIQRQSRKQRPRPPPPQSPLSSQTVTQYHDHQQQQQQLHSQSEPPAEHTQPTQPRVPVHSWDDTMSVDFLRVVVTLLHALQAFCGYLLMLVTMTFSIELFLAVIVGLAMGYAIFFQLPYFVCDRQTEAMTTQEEEDVNTPIFSQQVDIDDRDDGMDHHDEDLHVTSNPCCEFMAEESREVSHAIRNTTTTNATSTTQSNMRHRPSRARRQENIVTTDEENATLMEPLLTATMAATTTTSPLT